LQMKAGYKQIQENKVSRVSFIDLALR